MPTTLPRNYWREDACAKAFWNQKDLPPYQELLADTIAWLQPKPHERWLDLGCGSGPLTKALWEVSQGRLAEVLGVDVAAINAVAYARLRQQAGPTASECIRFRQHDLSQPFDWAKSESYDGVVCGLALQYAEHWNEREQRWTEEGYDRVLAETFRVLKPGGRFIFSVNVPNPGWGTVAWRSLAGVFTAQRPLRYLQKAWRMYSYGAWLKEQAAVGRFLYLPAETIVDKLNLTGFVQLRWKLSYAQQAYVFRCSKPRW